MWSRLRNPHRSHSGNQPSWSLILSPVPWPAGTPLNLRNQKTNRSIVARVVWTGPDDGTGSFKLGVEFEDAESGFWGNDYHVSGK
jgi:hypothetical protein